MNDARQVKQTLDNQIETILGQGKRFSMRICTEPFTMSQEDYNAYSTRYKQLMEFMKISEQIFKSSFSDKNLDFILKWVLGEVDQKTLDYHKAYYEFTQGNQPLFFRTDEPVPGKIVEIQAPGSGYASFGELQKAWSSTGRYSIQTPWEDNIVQLLHDICKEQPRVLYLPFTSFPDDRLIYQTLTAKKGIEYVNPENPSDFNFVKVHQFDFLFQKNLFPAIISAFFSKKTKIDQPPTLFYTEKIPLVFPFDPKTRNYYSDEIRTLFPYTTLVQPEGTVKINGEEITYDEFCKLSPSKRTYMMKYAGSHPSFHSGGKGVFSLKRTDKKECREMINQALKDYQDSIYWLLQEEINQKYEVEVLDNGKQKMHGRFSGFYGPKGLLAIRALFRNFYKVGGSSETAAAVVTSK